MLSSVCRSSSSPIAGAGGYIYLQTASFVEARIKWVRDRGLDHTVEREKNLRPLFSLKNFIFPEPSKSLPVSLAAEHKTRLGLPIRAIEFIRKYPSVFLEFPGPADPRRPHVRLTPESVALHEDERSVYENCRRETADRLFKLLMLTPHKKLPLSVVDRLKWDLGLPDDYVRSLLPDFPDYFDVTRFQRPGYSEELALELVCWSKDLAVSVMERRASGEYKKGMPLAFPLQFSRGFDLEKNVKKWVDDWQKLPYISPYEDGSHLQPKSDLAEKWLVGVLHELFHLFVGKKAEKETVLMLGEHLGLRSGFRRAFMHHPGIFYVSNKIRTHTVVLREAYKRDLLVEKHPLMGIRYQFIHLMNKGKDPARTVVGKSAQESSLSQVVSDDKDEEDDYQSEEDDEEEEDVEDEESEREVSGSFDDSSEDEDREEGLGAGGKNHVKRGPAMSIRQQRQAPLEMKRPMRSSVQARSTERRGQGRKQGFGKAPT